ncbi:MAG: hypothetical protein Q9219_003065 [cf. Caloplaca sp. 3 TL-2023]
MPSSETLTDEYLAQLIAKDAKDRATKYSSYGLQSYLPIRPTTNAPKPNTRFLKNIIKETDNHNASLRAREIADARARLRGINGSGTRNGRQLRDDERRNDVDGHSSKRRRLETEDDDRRRRRSSHKYRDDEKHGGRHRERYEDKDDISDPQDEVSRRRHRPRRQRRRSRSPSSDRKRPQRSSHRARHHSHPRSRARSGSPQSHHRSDHRRRYSSPSRSPLREASPTHSSDSDPLTSLIGPLPPSSLPSDQPLPRGRGALHSTSMDTHFTPSYDPSTDVQPSAALEAESLDWDNALEALRDRAKWKASGAERLRAAGFTDEEVGKWERGTTTNGGDLKDEENIRWKGRGERREWDRGKVVGSEGVEVEAEWGRLKGT